MKLRGALLGCGNIALRSHAPQWAGEESLRREVEIVAVADKSPANRDAALAILPGARAYASAEELLDREEVDFCDICTPPFTHLPLIEQAARRGRHVVCEKPLASTPEDADRIALAVRAAGIVFQPCHQYHYSPQWLAVRAALPRIGRLYFAEYEVLRTSANPGNANWSPAWRTDAALAGGGILADHGAHVLYQLHAVLGPPSSVQATVRTLRHHSYQVEDTAFVTLEYADALAQMRLTWAAQRREISFRFVGEEGELVGDDAGLRIQAGTSEDLVRSRHERRLGPRRLVHAASPWFRGSRPRRRPWDRRPGGSRVRSAPREPRLRVGRAAPLALFFWRGRGNEPIVKPEAGEIGLTVSGSPLMSESLPGPNWRRFGAWALRGAGLVVLVAGLAWTFYDVNWESLGQAMAKVHPGWLLLAAAVNFAVLFCQSARWLALVRPLSATATIGQAFKAMIVGFAVSTVVPARAGELARIEWFGRATGIPRVSIVGSVILDQLVNAAGLLVGLAALPLILDVPLWMRQGGYFALGLFVAGTMMVVAMRPAAEPADAGSAPGSRPPLRTLRGFLTRVRHGLVASRNPRALAVSFGVSLVAWGLEINVTALSMKALGINLPITASILVLIAVNLALAIPFAPPGNAGTLELGATLALLEFGVAKERALAFALCYHLLQVIPIGVIGFGLLSREMSPGARRSR